MKNNKYQLCILAPAQHELENIALIHKELAGAKSAQKIIDFIYKRLELLETNPNMGLDCKDRELKIEGYRMLVCKNYLCFYRLINTQIFVYHIVDGRTNYPKLINENR